MGKGVQTMRAAKTKGFTLVELMVTLAVLAILAVLAVPTFTDFRQRSSLRGAADQVVSFVGDARFEALRRNSDVKVGFRTDVAGNFCIGAATTTDPSDDTPCDCFTAAACDVSAYPASQADWRGVRVPANPTIGDTDSDADGVIVINPKRANLTEAGDAGRISLRSPIGSQDYRLDIIVDRNGRATSCQPAAAPSKIPEYLDRGC